MELKKCPVICHLVCYLIGLKKKLTTFYISIFRLDVNISILKIVIALNDVIRLHQAGESATLEIFYLSTCFMKTLKNTS